MVTGNEDGAHACAESILFNMTHLGCVIRPNVDTYWVVGDAGPGPSYLDAGGPEHPYTQRTSSWCAHNLVHMARIIRDNPIPADRKHPGGARRGRGPHGLTKSKRTHPAPAKDRSAGDFLTLTARGKPRGV